MPERESERERERERETERQEEKERERERGRKSGSTGGRRLAAKWSDCPIPKNNSVSVRFYSGETRLKILSVSDFIPEKPELELAVSVSVRFKSPGI